MRRRGGGQGIYQGEGTPLRKSTRTRCVGVGVGVDGAEREARRKKGGRGVAEAPVAAAAMANRLLTMDVERSEIWIAVRMISLSDEARRRFFLAPVRAEAAASPAERAVAYALDRLEGTVTVGAAG